MREGDAVAAARGTSARRATGGTSGAPRRGTGAAWLLAALVVLHFLGMVCHAGASTAPPDAGEPTGGHRTAVVAAAADVAGPVAHHPSDADTTNPTDQRAMLDALLTGLLGLVVLAVWLPAPRSWGRWSPPAASVPRASRTALHTRLCVQRV